MNYETIRKAALLKANQVRKRLGLPEVDRLYKGNRSDAYSCPITNTIFDDDLDRNKFIIMTGRSDIRVFDKDKAVTNSWGEIDFMDSPTVLKVNHNQNSRAFVEFFDDGAWDEKDGYIDPFGDLAVGNTEA